MYFFFSFYPTGLLKTYEHVTSSALDMQRKRVIVIGPRRRRNFTKSVTNSRTKKS